MKTADLKKYLEYILELELSVYEQEKAIERMELRVSGLGKHKTISQPYFPSSNIDFRDYCGVTGMIGLAIGVIITIVDTIKMEDGIIWKILSFIVGGIIVCVVSMGIGVVAGFAIAMIRKIIEFFKRRSFYQLQKRGYECNLKQDDERVINEQYQKRILIREIEAVKTQLEQSRDVLYKAYSFNVIHRDYWNMYAVSSFYSYLIKGKTYSLKFNPKTGDQGAYNIYDNECRLDRIIMNTEEILYKLDRISETQTELANGLKSANKRVDALFGKVSRFMNKTTNQLQQIGRCQDVIAYNSEIARRDVEILTWMEILRR